MDEDFEEMLEELLGDDENPAPTYRAVIRRGRLTITGWAPWLAAGGPLGKLLRERERRGVAIADLTLYGEKQDELAVRFYATPDREGAEQVLIEWAGRVGYRRLWLADRMVEVEPSPEQIGTANVRCPTCHAAWADSDPEFWLAVRRDHHFPFWCPVCGHQLPQWRVRADRPSDGDGAVSGSAWSSDTAARGRQERT